MSRFSHSIRTKRFDLESSSLSEEFVICRPSEFHGWVLRNLSPWHQEIPSLEVFAEMGDVAVCVSPEDVRAVKTLTNSATTELGGQAARTEEEVGEKEEAVGKSTEHEIEGEVMGCCHCTRRPTNIHFVLWLTLYTPLLSPFREASSPSFPFTRRLHSYGPCRCAVC